MGAIKDGFETTFRPFVTDGVPASGPNKPSKAEAVALGKTIEIAIGGVAAGLRPYATKALLDADTTQPLGTLANVYDDPTPANNGVYHYETGGWVVDDAYYEGVAAVVQPIVDEATEAAALIAANLPSRYVSFFEAPFIRPSDVKVSYGRMYVITPAAGFQTVDPADYGLASFDLFLSPGNNVFFHYIDVSLIGNSTGESPVKESRFSVTLPNNPLFVPIALSVNYNYTPFWTVRDLPRDLAFSVEGGTAHLSSKLQLLYEGVNTKAHIILGPADSYTHSEELWSGQFARNLKARYGDGGPGWSGFGHFTGSTVPSGNVDNSAVLISLNGYVWPGPYGTAPESPDLSYVESSTAGDRITYNYYGTRNLTRLALYAKAGTGTVRYRFNAGSWTTLSLSAAALAFSGVPSGAFVLELEVVSGTPRMYGIYAANSQPGVIISTLAVAGSSLRSSWSLGFGSDPIGYSTTLKNSIAQLHAENPITAFIPLISVNDARQDIPIAEFATGLATFVDSIARGVNPRVDIIWFAPAEFGDNTAGPPMWKYTREVYKAAAAKGFRLRDMQPDFGRSFGDYSDLYIGDQVHPSVEGGATIRRIVSGVISPAMT